LGLSLVTAPAVEPVTLLEAKAHLKIDNADDDGLIAGYILAATRDAESYIRGKIIRQTWDYTLDYEWPIVSIRGMARDRIELPFHPVRQVLSVSYVDENGATQTLSPSLYTVRMDTPVAYVEKAYDASWPAIRSVPAAITVRFIAGYDPESVPDEIRTAILLHIESMYDRCDDDTSCDSCRKALLDPYRQLRVA
jgi:uncharacterized phiE125 gp8 family phage protein